MDLGYNSQFDIDRQVEEASERLDQDVDFNKWLKNIPDDEEEDAHHEGGEGHEPPRSQNQKSDAGMDFSI